MLKIKEAVAYAATASFLRILNTFGLILTKKPSMAHYQTAQHQK
jgi:hypothetical protein